MSRFVGPDDEMNLMCHVIMDDSCWLDSFQNSILSGDGEGRKSQSILLNPGHDVSCRLYGSPALNLSESRTVASRESGNQIPTVQYCKNLWSDDADVKDLDMKSKKATARFRKSHSVGDHMMKSSQQFVSRTISAPTPIIDQLPAPEFVDGTRSVIACESFRMIAAVAAMDRTSDVFEGNSALHNLA